MDEIQVSAGKLAAQSALNYFNDFFKSNNFSNILLEEIEKEGSNWLITLGYDEPASGIGLFPKKRSYKIFKIDKVSYAVESMKIRKFD